MALRESTLRVRFAGGIETKADAKLVPSVKLLGLENGVFTKAITISKRNGYEELGRAIESTSDMLSGAMRLGVRDAELLAFTDNRCYSRSSIDEWANAGPVFSAISADRPLVRTGTQQTAPDHATKDGVTVVAWEDSRGGVWWSCVDASNGRIFRAPAQAHASGQRPRCVAVGSLLHVYYAVPADRRIDVIVVNPATPSAAVSSQILVSDLLTSNPVYDACPTERTNQPALIAWAEFGTTNFRVGFVDPSGVLGSPVTGHPSVYRHAALMHASSPISVAWHDVDASEITVSWAKDSGGYTVRAAMFTDAIALTIEQAALPTATSIDRIACAWASGGLWVVAEETDATPSEHFCRTSLVTTTSVTVGSIVRSVGLASRAFQVGDAADAFAVFVHDTTHFGVYVTLRLSDFVCAGRHLPGLAAGLPSRSHTPSAHVTSDVVAMALPYRERLLSENDDKFTETGVRFLSMDFDSEDTHISAQMGRGLYLAGACPQHYDGRVWTEQGFHVGPDVIATLAGSSGGSLTAGTRVYRAWYEWTDAQGEIHRGPTSIGTTVVLTTETEVTLTLPTLRITQKSNVRICVARSKAGNELQLFRVTSMDPTASGPNGYVANDTTVDTVSFVDRMSDTTLGTQEPLYTNGGILSNDPAPIGSVVAAGKGRLFATDPGDGNAIRYSQPLDEGYGVEFPPRLVLKCDAKGGDVRGLAVMDGVVYAFKESTIFGFGGDGPTADGSAAVSGFSSPEELLTDVGCTDPASIATTPDGIYFKSAKGIYRLGRDRSVTYIGAPVERYNSQSIRRATVMPDRTQIVFLTDDGTTLMYDYFYGQWSTFTNHTGRDAAVVSGRYHYLRTDERVFRETPGLYSDANARIRLRIETAWLHMQEHLQGFQRFWHLHVIGDRKSGHQLGVQYQLDYIENWSEPFWLDATGSPTGEGWIGGWGSGWTADSDDLLGTPYGGGAYGDGPYGGNPPDVYQWKIHLGEVGQAIRFRFEDYEVAGQAGQSLELSELLITGGVKANARKPFSAGRSA